MPLIRIQTNTFIENYGKLSEALTVLASEWLNKPKKYIMVMFMPELSMTMAGNFEPCAFIEFSSISLERSQIKPISIGLTNYISRELNIRSDRIYIEFKNAEAECWSCDGVTFG
ncbi:MAG: hypothetical protein A2X11_02345 [Bacteroidetes bacterium GWE2_42_24]|nr:MAG: hypothetical protein A2X11_02345 [Bacteroidetes bacterium GWE2_42_24]OFY25410.1 MAG: hypothetical protein A2X09_02970 [Bacteroidetes bacterium GWF2_43_11]PKP26957.1 MAG: hypothetical protein CVU06_03230 [Bacteroidetes bacterium HGW-Bacteroidetes-22]